VAQPSIVACPSCGTRNRVPAAVAGTPRCSACHTNLPWIVDTGDADVAEVVDAASMPVLVDLWAPWCGPCRMVSPILEQLARRHAGSVKLVKVNVDESPATAQRFAAQSIPTLVLVDHGEVRARQVGAAPEHVLDAWLAQGLAGSGGPR
jgi:thioredoxin 2